MKQNFITGLVILLPVAITFWVLGFLVNLLTNPFLDFTENILQHIGVFDEPLLFFTAGQVLLFWSRLFILLFLSVLTLLTGFLAHALFLDYYFSWGDRLIVRIPVINRIYVAAKDGVNAIFKRGKNSKIRMVMVPYPYDNVYCLGLMTQQSIHPDSDQAYQDKASICVIGSPNPTFGIMLIYPMSQVITLDMTVEEGLKYLVSCGTTGRIV